MSAATPSELELQILSLLWEQGPLTAREVLERLPDNKPRAYTSVLSVMQVMAKKGYLSKKREGMTHRWSPVLKQAPTLGKLLGGLMTRVFRNSPSAVMQHLMETPEMTPEEIAEIKRLIAKKEKGAKK